MPQSLVPCVDQLVKIQPFTAMTPLTRSPGRRFAPALLAIALAAALARIVPAEAEPDPASETEHFKYGSIGIEQTEGLPYWIWQVLPRMFPEKLPGPGGYSSLGLIWEKGRELPIGFAKRRINGTDRVAVNCAFCHTSSVRVTPDAAPMIVPGGPSHQFDPQAYVRFLQAAAGDPRFRAGNVMREIDELTDLSWFNRLRYRFLYIPGVRSALAKQRRDLAWMDAQPAWGPGRIDPFNRAKFSYLRQPVDGTVGNSDMVPIWQMRARRGLLLHWDGLNGPLREVVLSSALGDGASPRSMDLGSLERVETWLLDVAPPRFPYPVDAALAAAGEKIYSAGCAECHAFNGARTGTVVPLAEVGTDRNRLDMWTSNAAAAYNAYGEKYSWDFDAFQKTDGYVAMPLDGVWLRAPYLHNGSVPSLRDLLAPAENRPAVFHRGYDVYDPERVGFVSSGPDAERLGFRYDTSLRGNGNQGHAYGTDLPQEQKRALIEFLKTQ
jgi:mono/diheme cytochrome c family protein